MTEACVIGSLGQEKNFANPRFVEIRNRQKIDLLLIRNRQRRLVSERLTFGKIVIVSNMAEACVTGSLGPEKIPPIPDLRKSEIDEKSI